MIFNIIYSEIILWNIEIQTIFLLHKYWSGEPTAIEVG
jgi:hypothetical protein